jgi:hypothetical protein
MRSLRAAGFSMRREQKRFEADCKYQHKAAQNKANTRKVHSTLPPD